MKRSEREKKMLIVTINEIPGKKLEALGVVRGSKMCIRDRIWAVSRLTMTFI